MQGMSIFNVPIINVSAIIIKQISVREFQRNGRSGLRFSGLVSDNITQQFPRIIRFRIHILQTAFFKNAY
jgi:hypothetical protein